MSSVVGRRDCGQSSRYPQQGKRCQRTAARCGQSGPSFSGGEQKPNDHSDGEAKEHLVGMPKHG
jgi:hypothetical protein